jgi:hypothetical protein
LHYKLGESPSVGREGPDSLILIVSHEAAVTFDVGTKNGREFTFKFLCVHGITAPDRKAPTDIQEPLGGFLIGTF